MEARDFYIQNGERVFNITFEEHIANIFRILNSGDLNVDTITIDFFDTYARFIKKLFDEKNIKLYTDVGFWGYKDIFDHGIFGPFMYDINSKSYDGFALINPISQEEYMERYMNYYPAEVIDVLTSEKVYDYVRYHYVSARDENITVEVRSKQQA